MVWAHAIGVFHGLPWLQWGERQMVLFDLGARRFYLFGLVLYPQDFIYLTGLLIIVGALAVPVHRRGRAVVVRLYLPANGVHRNLHVAGAHASKATAAPACAWTTAAWTLLEKIRKKASKQLAWITVALVDGLYFCGLLRVPIRDSWGWNCWRGRARWQIFWVLFYGFATYGIAGFHARAGVQIHVPLCPLPERHVRQGHP